MGAWSCCGRADSLPPVGKVLGLYAAFAPNPDASGVTGWSEPIEIVHGQVLWSQLLATGDGGPALNEVNGLHRAWQQLSSGQEILLHQVSTDGGLTWSESSRITGTENTSGPVEMAADSTRLQMVQLVPAPAMDVAEGLRYQLRRWTWGAETGWTRQESQPIPNLLQAGVIGLGTAGDPAGETRLGVVYTGEQASLNASEPETETVLSGLFAQNAVDSSAPAASLPTDEITPTPVEAVPEATGTGATPQATLETTPTGNAVAGIATPTPAFQRQAPGLVQRTLNQASSPLLAGLVPAILLVLVIFLLINRHKVKAITRQKGKK